MGLFSFLKNIGKKVMPGREADEIQADITEALGSSVKDLSVAYNDGTVTLGGTVESVAAKEKAVLLAGNVESVESVDDNLAVVIPAPPPRFYTIEKGDSLSKIAKEYYGDPMKYKELFEANKEVIKDPDLIYPGQQIRVPHL
ncbi:MAG: peptidoglycan-binding protein LysM [Rhodothermales bacterium]|nr:peptidoglycan-binding protein LysM [Rhodothermales bacterium]